MPANTLFDFTIVKTDDKSINAKVTVNPSNPVFKGHFPNQPVTPGVMQLMLVRKILEQHFKKELNVISMNRVKFLAVLNPNESPEIEVEIIIVSLSEEGIKIKAKGWNDKAVFFKFSALYQ